MSERLPIGEAILSAIGSSDDALEQVQEIIDRLARAGFVIVPRYPTEEMMAAVDCADEKANWISGKAWKSGYSAMIAAALAS